MTATAHGVLVLGGGPDAEREVSLQSAEGVASALAASGLEVHRKTIDTPTPGYLASMPGRAVFPVLHGPFGEGGPMQDLLAALGRPYVGCGPVAARLAMDKVASKIAAARAGVPTAISAVLNPRDDRCPLDPSPGVVLKPIHEGSSVGVHMVSSSGAWPAALDAARADMQRNPGRSYMVEAMVRPDPSSPGSRARELTVGMLDRGDGLIALPVIEIRPATDFYDYAAKYLRDDTTYTVLSGSDPVVAGVQTMALAVARALGVRHLCRVDFLDPGPPDGPQFLEINTMPGFTSHSLLPMAADAAGIPMPDLCRRLVELALAEGPDRG